MLLVLGLVVGLLFVAPAILLGTGRLIMSNTGPRSRPGSFGLKTSEPSAQAAPGSIHREDGADEAPWFRRPMLPAFGEYDEED